VFCFVGICIFIGCVSTSSLFKLTISENPSECLDPDTGLNHTLGLAWNIPGVCGQAHCELRNQQVYISYAFCGSAQAEAPCYLSSTDLSLPYPYCCPRSICPARNDVQTNLIDTDDYEDELQMAAATWDDASEVRVAPPAQFVAPHPEGEENQDQVHLKGLLPYITKLTNSLLLEPLTCLTIS